MPTQLAELETVDSRAFTAPPAQASTQYASFDDADDDRLGFARGLMRALAISTPFWMLFGFVFYLLL